MLPINLRLCQQIVDLHASKSMWSRDRFSQRIIQHVKTFAARKPQCYFFSYAKGEHIANARCMPHGTFQGACAFSAKESQATEVCGAQQRRDAEKSPLASIRYSRIYAKGEERVDLKAFLLHATKAVEKERQPYAFIDGKGANHDNVRTISQRATQPVVTSFAREQKPSEARGIHQEEIDAETAQRFQEKQRAINAIVEDIHTDGSWNSIAGDLAVSAVTQLPTWPASLCLKIGGYAYYYDGAMHDTAGGRTPIALQLNAGHYSPIIGGQVKSVAGDGNCFYRSLLLALGEGGQRSLLGDTFVAHRCRSVAADPNHPNVGTLRQMLATHLRQHPGLIDDFLQKQFISYQEIIKDQAKVVA